MPILFCPHCGYKHSYGAVKPKACESCNGATEPKVVIAKTSRPSSRYDLEEEPVEEKEFDAQAIRIAGAQLPGIHLEREAHDDTFVTVEQLRKSGMGSARGAHPINADIQKEVLGGLLGGAAPAGAPNPPPETRGAAKRTGKLRR